MRIISWNVNGLRACIKKGFFDFFDAIEADIFCMQEIRLDACDIEYNLNEYTQYWNFSKKKGFSGTAIFVKEPALRVFTGMSNLPEDEGRVISLEYDNYYIVNCYAPYAQRGLEHLEYKKRFNFALADHINKLREEKPIVLCGDLNVAHKEIDLKNYKSNKGNAGFTDSERNDFDNLLAGGYVDSYRLLYPEQGDAFTWWSYRKTNY